MKKRFTVVVERGEDGYFIGSIPELPGCHTQAKTEQELLERMKEAIGLYLETINELKSEKSANFLKTKAVVVNA